MEDEEKQVEALKALADWSKWLISIETALLTVLFALVKWRPHLLEDCGHFYVIVPIVFFAVSIVAATLLLGAIPNAIANVPLKNNDIHAYKQFGKVSLRNYAAIEHVGFIFGIIFLVLFLIVNISVMRL